jgi:hypothetical protein
MSANATSTSIINGLLRSRRAILACEAATANVRHEMARARRLARRLELASLFNATHSARLRARGIKMPTALIVNGEIMLGGA